VHLARDAAARDQDEPTAALRELVGELHRDPAAERVPDDGGGLRGEPDQEVADPGRVGAERVVAARLRGLAVPEQVGGEDRVAVPEELHHGHPLRGIAGDPVDQDDQRAAAGEAEGDPMAVDPHLVELTRIAPLGERVERVGVDRGSRGRGRWG
jgi:hypothetical protein